MTRALSVAFVAAAAVVLVAAQGERLDHPTLGRIRDEAMSRSQVMDHVFWLSDVYGPRVTGSLQMQQASEWAMKRFAEWGLRNIHQERWPFGRGWTLVRFNATLVEPQVQPLIGFPNSWTPGTNGTVSAEVVRAPIATEADLDTFRGKLAGRIVLAQAVRTVRMLEGPLVLRMNEQQMAEAQTIPAPAPQAPPAGRTPQAAAEFRRKVASFYASEGVVAVFERGSDSDMAAGGSDLSWQAQRVDGGTVFPGSGGPRDAATGVRVPVVTLAVEHYNRMVRLIDRAVPVRVELHVETRFLDEDVPNGLNTIAELPGTDLASEIVMIGAHLDSEPAATGATDNAAGVAAIMEAMRVLTKVGVRPRRTIRIALWGGEEQGLLGSRAYVREHFGDPATMVLKPEHHTIAAYFNSDNGTGRVRGVWLQGNQAVQPIFAQWIAPLRDLGVTMLAPRSVGATDHVAFDEVGIPAFEFLLDRLEYASRTHHSNMDLADRVQPDDLRQQATVVATFLYDAAMRDEKLPRKALPPPRKARTADRVSPD